jgi:hypothetical protein
MKKQYTNPELLLVRFEDVITASGDETENANPNL